LGLFYLWELPLILVGSYQLAKGRFKKETKLFIGSWVLIGPLAAAFTTGAPHAMRAFNVLPGFLILSALGGLAFWNLLAKQKQIFKYIASFSALGLLIISLGYLSHQYLANFPQEQSDSFQYPLAQAIKFVLLTEDDYQEIVVTDEDHGQQAYMFYLFFSQHDPQAYLSQGGTVSGGYDETHRIGKYRFRSINWKQEKKTGRILFIGNDDDFPSKDIPLAEFNLLNNQSALKVMSIKQDEEKE
jgi:hypothetical protein